MNKHRNEHQQSQYKNMNAPNSHADIQFKNPKQDNFKDTSQHNCNTIDTNNNFKLFYFYYRRGKNNIDGIFLLLFISMLTILNIYFIKQLFNNIIIDGFTKLLESISSVIVILGLVLLILFLFPYGYGRFEIDNTKIRVIPGKLFNPFPRSIIFMLNRPTYITYYQRIGLIFVSQGPYTARLNINGIKKEQMNNLIKNIVLFTNINKEIKFSIHDRLT